MKFRNRNIRKLIIEGSNCKEYIQASTLRQLTSLECLRLCSNAHHIASYGVETLTGLTYLDISNNALISSKCLENLTNLKSLDLYDNKVIKSLKTIQKLSKLENLGISVVSSILPKVKYLTNLKSLCIQSFNDSEEQFMANIISDTFTHLFNLHTLLLFRCPTCECHDLKKLTNLTSLSVVGSNQITNDDLSILTNLTFLRIESTNITGAGISSLTNLTELNCWNSPNIREDGFEKLSQLTCVWLHRGINITPEAFRNSTQISIIKLPFRSILDFKKLSDLTKIFPLLRSFTYPDKCNNTNYTRSQYC